MNNKIALVTGASRGIGSAIATHLIEQGYRVIGTATSPQGLKAIDPKCIGKLLRLEEEASVLQLFGELKEEKLLPTILVANAGITADNLILRMKMEEWQKTLDVNLTGNFLLCQQSLKQMVREKWGRIVCVSSVVGFTGNPGQVNYAATKAGLSGFVKSLALEFSSRNITANIVAPGFIETDMTAALADRMDDRMREQLLQRIPLHRYGTAKEVAAGVGFLVSPEASYISGQVLHINGGMYMA